MATICHVGFLLSVILVAVLCETSLLYYLRLVEISQTINQILKFYLCLKWLACGFWIFKDVELICGLQFRLTLPYYTVCHSCPNP